MIQEILTYIIIIWAVYKITKSLYNTFIKKTDKGCVGGNCSVSCKNCAFNQQKNTITGLNLHRE